MMGGGLLYIFFILLFFLCNPILAQEPEGILPDNMMMDTSATVFEYRRLGITVVAPSKGIEFLYMPNTSLRVREVAEQYRFNYLLNASRDSGTAKFHTGWLKIEGVQYGSLVADKYLTHVVRTDARTGQITFIPRAAFAIDTSNAAVEFQTGPLVIANGKPVAGLVQSPARVADKQRWTLLATIDNTEIFLLIARDRYSLFDLVKTLLDLSIFKGKKLDAIALNTGDSMILYSRNFPAVNLNVKDRVSLLIGIR